MTTFTCSTGGDEYFDAKSGGSVNATLDSYVISNNTRLIVRTDSYACPNHDTAFGSLDTVSFSGTGGTLHFDPTYVRVVAYTGGSGNAPAYGTTISQGGVSGVFLGAWTNWQSEPITPGSPINATGYIKIGGKTGGNFAAGALTGITATCSGADVQGWIEVRGESTTTCTVPRVGAITTEPAWFELGTTNGSRGQVIECPTTATNAGVFPGVWIETAAGSGVYERYVGVGSMVANSATSTGDHCKFVWQTTGGIRIGSDGTNSVGFLPVTGCKVRIPAIIWTNCTRSVSGSGPRVLPNATLASRYEFATSAGGYLDVRGVVSQWYMNFAQPYYVRYADCAINDKLYMSEVASPLDVDNCIVGPTQAQVFTAFEVSACYAGGTVQNSRFARFSLATSGGAASTIGYTYDTTFSNVVIESLTLRTQAICEAIDATQNNNCTFTNLTLIGARFLLSTCQDCTITNPSYYDHNLTTTTTSTNPMSGVEFDGGSSGCVVDGFSLPLTSRGPRDSLVTAFASSDIFVKNIGTSPSSPLAMNSSVTGRAFYSQGRNSDIRIKRVYVTGTRVNPWTLLNSDNGVTIENMRGDYADTAAIPSLNTVFKNVGFTGTDTGQTSTYGTHWGTSFTSTTAGFVMLYGNEPTAASASQCAETGGSPQFDSVGSVLLTKASDQVTWEMPFYAVGYTAITNVAPTVSGVNVTFSSGSSWGNHTLEYQIDLNDDNGYSAWTALNETNLSSHTISSTLGFKLKIRATTLTPDATNAIRRIAIPLTTTSGAQDAGLYPLITATLTLDDLVSGSDVVIFETGTETVLYDAQNVSGTSTSYTYGDFVAVDIAVYKTGYVPFFINNYTLSTEDATLPVAQVVDSTYIA